jgi:hypothetical protein
VVGDGYADYSAQDQPAKDVVRGVPVVAVRRAVHDYRAVHDHWLSMEMAAPELVAAEMVALELVATELLVVPPALVGEGGCGSEEHGAREGGERDFFQKHG